VGDSLCTSDLGQGVEDRGEAVGAVQDSQRTGQQARFVAERDAHAPLACVDAEDATLGHCRATWDPER
jgi:hypothetical protein